MIEKTEEAAPELVAPTPVGTVGKPKSITTSVWAPAGGVPKASILQSAIESVRDAIPVVYDLKAEIVSAKKAQHDKQDGTTFDVEITYTERELAGNKADPVDLEKVIKGLEVPKAIHDGDSDFLDH